MMTLWQTPAIVLTFAAWLASPPASLADVARREQLRRAALPPAVQVATNEDLARVPPRWVPPPEPPPDQPPGAPPATDPAKPDPGRQAEPPAAADRARDETYWRERMAGLRDALERDELLAAALETRVNALANDAISRDDPAQRAKLLEDRRRALEELERLRKQVDAGRQAIDAALDDARRAGVPPAWVR